MENITDKYIGKTFLIADKCGVNSYTVIAYDEKWESYICRNNYFHRNYTGFTLKTLEEEAIFDEEKFIKEIDKKIEEKKQEFEKYILVKKLANKNNLFMHNFYGVCEGMLNIKSCSELITRFEKDKEKYKKLISLYKKEILKYEKGIRRNKKVLHRILTKEEYDYLENIYSSTAIDDMRKLECNLNTLLRKKTEVLKAFNELKA